MKIVLKHIAFLLAFLMLMTSCYTYRETIVDNEISFNTKDKVTVVTDAIEYRKIPLKGIITDSVSNGIYKKYSIKSVTDSTIVIKKGIEVLIQIDDIEYLEIGKLNKEKTSYAIAIPAIALFTILSFMFVYISNSF